MAAPTTPVKKSSRNRRVPQELSKVDPNIQMPSMLPNQCQKPKVDEAVGDNLPDLEVKNRAGRHEAESSVHPT